MSVYTIAVRDHIFVAHSLEGKMFGPAQNLHGATYIIDAEFGRSELNEEGAVIDIGLASEMLSEVVCHLNYQNLDKLDQFRGVNTTTEFLARHIHEELARRLPDEFTGRLKITLHESHVASASYEGSVG